METRPEINNAFYDELGARWYEDDRHPVAILRAESKHKLRYVEEILKKEKVSPKSSHLRHWLWRWVYFDSSGRARV